MKKLIPFLKVVANTERKQVKAILSTVTKSQVQALGEIAVNTLKGNVPLTTKSKQKLRRYKKLLVKLANPKLKFSTKKLAIVKNLTGVSTVILQVLPFVEALQ